MSMISIKELSQGYGDKTLYKDAAFEVYKGEHIGIVGQNGVGKSTLLDILAGKTVPDTAVIQWQKGVRVGYLDQHAQVEEGLSIAIYLRSAYERLYAQERQMILLYEEGSDASLARAGQLQEELLSADFYDIDTEISRITIGLGLTALGLDTPLGGLSGGQRAKVIMAKLLLEQADLLLLDEPTNFLDAAHVDWLADYLHTFPGAYLIVSHDHSFLERIATGILDIEFGGIRKFSCGYREFLRQKAHLREDYVRQYHAQQREIAQTEAFIRRNIAGQNTRIAQGRRTRLERLERLEKPEHVEKPRFCFTPGAPLPPGRVLEVQGLQVGYDFPLLPGLSFQVEAGQKLVITGFNGIGKSTLLKTLVGQLPALGGSLGFTPAAQVGYYAQELGWEVPGSTPLEIISHAFPAMTGKEVRRALAQCGVKAEHVRQPVATLSGGEQSKVKLCRLMLCHSNLLILDEPTNHLDAETKEALQASLSTFPGSVILVSHEERFYRGWADRVLQIG